MYHKMGDVQRGNESIQMIHQNLPDNLTFFGLLPLLSGVAEKPDQDELFWRIIEVIEPQGRNFQMQINDLKIHHLWFDYFNDTPERFILVRFQQHQTAAVIIRKKVQHRQIIRKILMDHLNTLIPLLYISHLVISLIERCTAPRYASRNIILCGVTLFRYGNIVKFRHPIYTEYGNWYSGNTW